jgi:hypothetical protein
LVGKGSVNAPVAGQCFSSRYVTAATDARKNRRAVGSDVSCAIRAEAIQREPESLQADQSVERYSCEKWERPLLGAATKPISEDCEWEH